MVQLKNIFTRSVALTMIGFLSPAVMVSVNAQDRDRETGTVNLLMLGQPTISAPIGAPTITASVIDVVATKTTYFVGCGSNDCPLVGGTVFHEPTRWEYKLHKLTWSADMSGRGSYLARFTSLTTGNIVCDATSNGASCTGAVTSYHTSYVESSDGKRLSITPTSTSGSTTINTFIRDVSAALVPVTVTNGMWMLPTTTTTTSSSSSGAAAPAFVTQPALLVGAAVMVGGALMA